MTIKSSPKSPASFFDLSKAPSLGELSQTLFEGTKRATEVHLKATQEQHHATTGFIKDLSSIKPTLSLDAWEEGYRKTLSYLEETQARTRKWFEDVSNTNTETGKKLKDLFNPASH